ncbi:MAG: hypothetical protein LWW83_06460 [Azonexaceae bacterium]|nr:hypothetical protein [Azonexaceae bacterium]
MSDTIELDHRFFERYRYAIIDGERRDEVPAHWSGVPIAPAFLEKDTARCPLLIDFCVVPEVDRNMLLDHLEVVVAAREESLISLALASTKAFRPLLRHLAERLAIRVASGGLPRQFRYFDPGTFIQLPDVLGSLGMSWLLGPVDAVAVPWLGEWRRYGNPGEAGAAHFDLKRQIDALQALSVVNRVLTQLPNIQDQDAWRQKSLATRRIVDHARHVHALDVRDDLVAFAMHAWQWHPAFDRHPVLQQLFAELAAARPEDEIDYRELTGRLQDADWQGIVRDMQNTTIAEGNPR